MNEPINLPTAVLTILAIAAVLLLIGIIVIACMAAYYEYNFREKKENFFKQKQQQK